MAKVIMISPTFLKSHPKSGKETLFIEKVWKCIGNHSSFNLSDGLDSRYNNYLQIRDCISPKNQTIRSGNRIVEGDSISIRVWKDKPYRSKQIPLFNRDIKVKKTYKILMDYYGFKIEGSFGKSFTFSNKENYPELFQIAQNDGLHFTDFLDWFGIGNGSSFEGQIICWGDSDYLENMINNKI